MDKNAAPPIEMRPRIHVDERIARLANALDRLHGVEAAAGDLFVEGVRTKLGKLPTKYYNKLIENLRDDPELLEFVQAWRKPEEP